MITQEYIDFFEELATNNHKEWFDANRKRYEDHVRKPFIELVESLIPALMEVEPSILPDAKKALFRINRDIRFSKDKTPYNTMMKAGLSPGGKKSELPGFYLGIGADNVHLGGGLYQLDKNALKNVRALIAGNTDEFLDIINASSFKKYFGKLKGDQNKRIDSEFQPTIEQTSYILNKQFYAMATLPTSQFINESNQAEALMGYYRVVQPLHSFLNKAFA
ncbi:MAG: DUF2461 domain-containing protein [Balneolaceae bacterium]|nr:DUF2461 domain-containing protein [Balneolaceae bacterium]MBO6547678.1 DUF2461 domain-containing protein [Balneolaceae bacterium]MBO6648189.1 DUF2461 domain-containing protein [Balneolaceae bacterium]